MICQQFFLRKVYRAGVPRGTLSLAASELHRLTYTDRICYNIYGAGEVRKTVAAILPVTPSVWGRKGAISMDYISLILIIIILIIVDDIINNNKK